MHCHFKAYKFIGPMGHGLEILAFPEWQGANVLVGSG